ncbi:glycosyltransferase [candidate division WWE3 bacterium]|nr:glycosyltransferase [candidate division WWE3 bacterium]
MNDDIEFSIIVPAYNEEKTASLALTQILNFMNSYARSFEILFIDDGSGDSTVDVVEAYIRTHPEYSDRIRLIKNPHKGKAYGIRTGILNSNGTYALFTDADMATPMEELKRLMVWIKDHGFDVVIASREGVGALRKNEPLIRHVMGRIFNLIIKIVLLRGFEDTQCGFKVMKGEAAKDIFNSMLVFGENAPETKKPRVSAFDTELIVVALRRGYKVKAVPVTWTYTPSTRVRKIGESIDMLLEVAKIKLNDVAGRYSRRE